MTRLTRLTMLSAMTLGLVACGGGAKLGGGKEGAAQAAFQASQPAGRGSKTGQALVEQALASGAATLTIKADCCQGRHREPDAGHDQHRDRRPAQLQHHLRRV